MPRMFNELNALTTFDIWIIFKILSLAFLVIYSIFAFLLVRQTDLLNGVVGTPLSKILQAIALLHLSVAVALFIFALWLL